jgi:hypothetical protein
LGLFPELVPLSLSGYSIAAMTNQVSRFMVFFGVFWSALTLLFDGFLVISTVRQVRALTFASTGGTIISSSVTSRDDGDGGTTYGVAMQYRYSVGDREYSGHRFRYDTSGSSDCAWANTAVAERPPDTKVDVFYDPRNPEDSVLLPGLQGSDLFQLAFMTPFNMVMLGLWTAGWTMMRRKWFPPVAGGVKITTTLRQTRARLTQYTPVVSGFAALGLLSFLSIFVVGFFAGGFHPSLHTMLLTWGVILSGALFAGGWHWLRALAGKYDLVIDELNSSLELPATCGRKIRRRVEFDCIRDVRVETIVHPSSDDGSTMNSYALFLDLHGSQPNPEKLCEWNDAEKVNGFVSWLKQQLPRKTARS